MAPIANTAPTSPAPSWQRTTIRRPDQGSGSGAAAHISGMDTTETAAKLFALTTTQGTAMSETTLCATCLPDTRQRDAALDAAAESEDWDGDKDFKDCSGNDALECGCTAAEDC